MAFDDALRSAAEQNGVQQQFWDIFGRPHVTSPETNRAILTAIGFDCSSEAALEASLHRREEAENSRLMPPVLVVGANEPIKLPRRAAGVDLEVTTEQGDHWTAKAYVTGNSAELGLKLPLGYHEVK